MTAASEEMSAASSAQRVNECREQCGESSGLKLRNRRVQFIGRPLSYDRANERSERANERSDQMNERSGRMNECSE